MITREQIHELAQFEDPSACALSFYFQPTTPRNKAHKEEAILTKDLAREAMRQLETRTRSSNAATAMMRVITKIKTSSSQPAPISIASCACRRIFAATALRGNGARAKAVFACARKASGASTICRRN